MPNIILNKTEYHGIDAVGLPIIGGGETLFVDPSGTDVSASDVLAPKTFVLPNGSIATGTKILSPYGEDLELLDTYPLEKHFLKDTDFNTWTPSSTAATIIATKVLGTYSVDLSRYEYLVRFLFDAQIAYAAGTTKKNAAVRQIMAFYLYVYRKPSNLTNLASKTDNYSYCTTVYTAPFTEYYNANGADTMGWTSSYGIYAVSVATQFSNASTATPTLTVRAPSVSARCQSTYFASDMASAVDKNTSFVTLQGTLHRMKPKTSFGRAVWDEVIAKYNS